MVDLGSASRNSTRFGIFYAAKWRRRCALTRVSSLRTESSVQPWSSSRVGAGPTGRSCDRQGSPVEVPCCGELREAQKGLVYIQLMMAGPAGKLLKPPLGFREER